MPFDVDKILISTRSDYLICCQASLVKGKVVVVLSKWPVLKPLLLRQDSKNDKTKRIPSLLRVQIHVIKLVLH